jgi:hypothetical protein
MGADVSRVRFDPLRDFAGVVLQQGRLLLDGDFNELVALLDRRLRAETCDLTSFGPDPNHAGVAWVPRQTPDAFHVVASGGNLTIGRGRMYVDGLLAENHGRPPNGFDPLLRETTGTADTPYASQPYWPVPSGPWKSYAPLPSGGPHLAYLDVWEREVTYLEDPDLVEPAVGVDTTARMQTAWQVRLLPNIGNATCASHDADIPGWLDVIRPSAGRLTTATITAAPAATPCELPPSDGYRGRENQTFRVEIHDGGAPGTATFKWSRDNGSVAFPAVSMVTTTKLQLATLGRDDVLRISTGDWVEILDDNYELDHRPGVLRNVTVDDAEQTIAFTGALPADLQPADDGDAAARHLRVRRWDQAHVVLDGANNQVVDLDQPGATGLITVPASAATQIQLESGIVVSFSLAAGGSGRFRSGDYWIFAARTANQSVETLTAAPPLGVQHHYARLGTVTFPSSQTDCRRLWPPLAGGDESCDCTVCVTPDSHKSGSLTIQMAVAQVIAAGGGTVCLEAGLYGVTDPVVADGAVALRIHGQGLGSLVVATGTAFTAARTRGLTIESLAILSGADGDAAIDLQSAILADVHDVAVVSYAVSEGGGSAIQLGGAALGVSLRRNVLVARTGIDAGGGSGDSERLGILGAAVRVEDNVVFGLDCGIDLGGRSAYVLSCRVDRNDVIGGPSGAIVATGAVAPGGTLDVTGNRIVTVGDGITVGPDATVDSNVIDAFTASRSPASFNADVAPGPVVDGIVVATGGFSNPPGHVRIGGNRVDGLGGIGISLATPVQTFVVERNLITRTAAGILITGDGAADRAVIGDNELLDIEAQAGGGPAPVGIGLIGAQAVSVTDNTIARIGLDLPTVLLRAGILVAGAADVRVTGNVVDGVGSTQGFTGLAGGIVVFGPFDSVTVSNNFARFDAATPGPGQGNWVAVAIESLTGARTFTESMAGTPVTGGAALYFNADSVYIAPKGGEHVGLDANMLSGGGADPTCVVEVTGDVVAQGNQCLHEGGELSTAMRLAGATLTASTNRARGTRAMILLVVNGKRFAAVGNLAPGGTHLNSAGGSLPAPWAVLNPTVS